MHSFYKKQLNTRAKERWFHKNQSLALIGVASPDEKEGI